MQTRSDARWGLSAKHSKHAILADIYSTIILSAPYVIAAYVLLWAALFAFVFVVMRRVSKAEEQVMLLEERMDDCLAGNRDASDGA